ncbi:MAG: glycosyltransferase family 2 protein [Candidatus Latescibacterota bacterium]|nr:MAG: glycosyltransferase family 2 protein [Candidatus Latescibacterota bacterium]
MPGLDIVIVNWNTGEQLRACLDSISAADKRGYDLLRVVVVDNASTDGSADGLERAGLPLALLRNDRNRGFAAACNAGVSGSAADYLLFLNPDTRLFADSLSYAVSFMELPENRGAGLAGVRLVDGSGSEAPSCSRFPTLGSLLSKSLGLHRLSRRLFPTYALPPGGTGEGGEVDYVTGAFFLARREVFEALGGFDERFFVYFEETDFARRMRARGWTCRHLGGASAYHRGGGASEQAGAERLFYAAASRILYARKHFGPAAAGVYVAAALTLEPAFRVAGSLVPRAGASPRDTVRAYGMLYRALPRVLRGLSVDGRSS